MPRRSKADAEPLSPPSRALALSHVDIHRRRLHLVADLSLTVRPGEILGVSGASGAGKTTLLRVIAGAVGGYSGRIQRPDGRLAFVFQEPRLLPWLSARDNVLLTLDRRVPGRFFIAEEWLERVGLSDAAGVRPPQMSGGMRQRVAIARAMVNRPKLLLADEPTGNLDPSTSVGIMRLLDRINRQGTTVVMATHDDEIVDQMRKRVIELKSGKVVRDQDRGVYGSDR